MSNGVQRQETERRIRAIRSAGSSDRMSFTRLVELSGLDPSKDLRFGNFSGIDFAGCNLNGYDLSGSRLVGCKFKDARISGALLHQCEYSLAEEESVHNVAAAEDYDEAYRSAEVRRGARLPSQFDEHLLVGSYFRDDVFSPLMQCVLAVQSDGTCGRFAIGANSETVDRCYNFWKSIGDRNNRRRDFVDSMSSTMHLSATFGYDVAPQDPFLLPGESIEQFGSSARVEVHKKLGLIFVKEYDSSRRLAQHRPNTHRLARRMRWFGCPLPLNHR